MKKKQEERRKGEEIREREKGRGKVLKGEDR